VQFCAGRLLCYATDGTGEASSFHRGGMNVLFADGSVNFLSQAISMNTFACLITASGGEDINPAT
jgi:prepilin-type processing-associated H-X9-DG protein